jgi:hypothetical protein
MNNNWMIEALQPGRRSAFFAGENELSGAADTGNSLPGKILSA